MSSFFFPAINPANIPPQNVTFLGNVFLMTFLTQLGFEGLKYIAEESRVKPRLDNDPQCGLTTGGRSECWWDCVTVRRVEQADGEVQQMITNPDCLSDCFPPSHCLSSLINDYKTSGICQGSSLDLTYPGVFKISDLCQVDQVENILVPVISRGVCSERTKTLLSDQANCVHPVFSQPYRLSVLELIFSMCETFEVSSAFVPFPLGKRKKARNGQKKRAKGKELNDSPRRRPRDRLTPVDNIQVFPTGVEVALVPPVENTRHRYPWLCSLRPRGQQSSHLCGVTLLARPPGPTVLVTSAHCTFLCKSREGNTVPNCCCPNVGPDTCSDNQDCGTRPETTEMTGEDVEVVCGEWDTSTTSGEEYNVVLTIEKIIRHPDFSISRGELNSQFVADDIAVIHVRDDNFEKLSSLYSIYPACLPTERLSSDTAVHSGWSKPPPLDFVVNFVPQYLKVYREFFRQWHYSMDIIPCKDPVTEFYTGSLLQHPSNSYYPPGTICATEINNEFCPTSGESGSPLIVQDQQSRFVAVGVKSFIKGCSDFDFRSAETLPVSSLNQLSENPAVYTRLSCYLPWVAAQYDMEFTPVGDPEPECLTGQGDITEVTAKVCRTNTFGNLLDIRDRIEAECLFPFTLNGVTHNACLTDRITEFTRPVFRCPIRTVRGAGANGTAYTDVHLIGGDALDGNLCPTNAIGFGPNENGQLDYIWSPEGPVLGPTGQLELDPDNQNCVRKRPIFATCKNNCPGVNFPVVTGGFALLAVTGAAATSFLPAAAGLGAGALGLAGVGGAAALMCVGPAFCTSRAGECCLLLVDRGRLICPDSCSGLS